jgi:four helix bundle protein
MAVAERCYELTRRFPREELFGMTGQIRRSAAAVPANVAEGYGRGSIGEYVQFLYVAQGSLKELETHLYLSQRVGLAPDDDVAPILADCGDLGKMLASLIHGLKRRKLNIDTRHPAQGKTDEH